ncbi:MAG TPA: DUF1684 domain-containing protein [Thermoanaerobaculia bacterium]|nr:DUF1684 domain-containing protein [Thermoanaerobaculia bacterium]
MKRVAALLVLLAACREEPKTDLIRMDSAHQEDVVQWQEKRDQRLRAEDSWLTLIGLHWLNEGANDITLKPGEDVRLARSGDTVTLEPSGAMTIGGAPVTAPVALRDDTHEQGPTLVDRGSIRFNVIKRGDRFALRVKDAQAETRTHFQGLEYFPIDPKWRVEARLEPYTPVRKIPIDDVTGMRSDYEAPGALVFTVDGKEYRLDPFSEGDELFIIFNDETRKDATYPAGRYLYSKKPGPDGKVIVDFNKAYNPPCAFTPFATCPLPPQQNRLPVRVEAGEKRYSGGHG